MKIVLIILWMLVPTLACAQQQPTTPSQVAVQITTAVNQMSMIMEQQKTELERLQKENAGLKAELEKHKPEPPK